MHEEVESDSRGAVSPAAYRLITLGRLALIDGAGKPELSLGTRRRKLALLAYLALRRAPVPRAVLLDLFWGARDERRARKSLSDALSHLRRVLGADLLLTHAADVAINPAALPPVDALELEAAAAAGAHARVCELYTGPFLNGIYVEDSSAFDDWSERERARLAELFAASCAVECERLRAAQHWRACAALASRWLEARPTASAAALHLIRAIAAPATRDALLAARDAYTRQRALLTRDYGLEPDSALQQYMADLERELHRAEHANRDNAVSADGAPAQLRALLRDAVHGAGAVAIVTGRRGSDRAALLSDAIAHAAPRALVLHATPAGSHAYAALCHALRELPRAVGLSGVPDWALGAISRLVPALRERWPALPQPTLDEHLLVEALTRTLADLACEGPIIVRIDDIDALDAASRNVLYAAAQRPVPAVAWLIGATAALELAGAQHIALDPPAPPVTARQRMWRRAAWFTGVAALLALALGAVYFERGVRHAALPDASIAVLPFELVGVGDSAFYAEGLTDEVINTLSRAPGLRVAARSSSYSLRGRAVPLREAGRRLGVQHLLEGSVRRDGDRLRIAVQLIDATTGFQRWSSSFEHTADDMFAAQAAVAQAVIGELAPRVRGSAASAPPQVVPTSREAYHAYLRGRYYWNRRRAETMPLAVASYEESIRHDSLFSPAWSGLAAVHVLQPWASRVSPMVAYPRALEHAETAIRLDPTNAEAYAVRGLARMFYEYDWKSSEEDLQRSVALEPGNASAQLWLSMNLMFRGRARESIDAARRAVTLDPLSPTTHANLSSAYCFAGQCERALAVADSGLALEDRGGAREAAGNAALALARYDVAIEHFSRSGGPGRPPRRPGLLAHALVRAGRHADAQSIADALAAEAAAGAPVAEQIALIHAAHGNGAAAGEWLARAYERREPGLIALAVDPAWSRVHDDPAVRDILTKIGLRASVARRD